MGCSKQLSFLFLIVLSLMGVSPTQAQLHPVKLISFPQHSKTVSPNGRYVIIGVDSDTEPHHTVFMDDRRLKTRRRLFVYGRGIELLWNPESKSFVLNDYAGSDYSECKVISVDEKVQSIDVWDEILKKSTGKERLSLLDNHHVYIAARKWISPDTLKVKVWGYGEVNPSGFSRFYTYDRRLGVTRVKP